MNAKNSGHPDIIIHTGGTGSRSFLIQTVREMRLDSSVSPNDAVMKVYILLNIQNMAEKTQNALLKILEEPPDYVMFILTCSGRSRVLETVQSRVTLVSLGPVPHDDVVRALLDQCPALKESDALLAAKLSGGIIGRAKKSLEEGGFASAAELAGRFAIALCGPDEYKFLRLSGNPEKDKVMLAALIELLPLLFRDACLAKAGVPGRISGCADAANDIAEAFNSRQLYMFVSICTDACAAAEHNANNTLMLTSLFSKLWQCAHLTVKF